MENKKSKVISIALTLVVVLMFTSHISYGQAPPPPGVPLDFGLSGLIAACIGYGAYRANK